MAVRLYNPKAPRSTRLVDILAGRDDRARRVLDLERAAVLTLVDQVRCVREAQRLAETTKLPAHVGEARRLAAELDQDLADLDRVAAAGAPAPGLVFEPLDGPAEPPAVTFADGVLAEAERLFRADLIAAGMDPDAEGGAW